jgi:ubiquinone/menaquinone biosynthesis C-methylase UbiE
VPQAKFTQINEFLKLLAHSGELEQLGAATDANSSSSSRVPVHILDAGCGSSHLTFGTFHYLHSVLGLPVRLSGVDTNRALMQRSNKACEDLGIADVAQFHTAGMSLRRTTWVFDAVVFSQSV